MACLQRQAFFMEKLPSPSTTNLLIFDVDGTLLDRNHQLAERTKAIVKRCQQSNLRVTLSTGKNWDSTADLIKELGIDQPISFSNGSIIRDCKGNLLERVVLPQAALLHAIDYCDRTGYDLLLYHDKDLYVRKITHNVKLLYDFGARNIIEIDDWKSIQDKFSQMHKFMVIERGSPRDLYQVEKEMRAELGDSVEYCQSLPAMFEVMAKGVSKGSALAGMCRLLDIDIKSVIAFGDGNNDIELLNAAGWGVTLANASALAKANADLLVPSVERCGPAKFLEYLLGV
jgi:Cof subfamily protein (haloacid dehalogenase superfamily)